MSSIRLDAYIFFKGNCREAMEFYQSIFGGKLFAQTYGDVGATTDETPADYIMHASLSEGDVNLLASDTAQASPTSKKISISLSGTDEEKLRTFFEKLGEGGQVPYPLKKEFWGDTFGILTDKFGVEWMVNISEPKSE